MNHAMTSPDATLTVRVVGWGEADFDAAQQGVSRLSALAVPGVIAPARVALRPDGAVVVEERVADGGTLASVLAARGSLKAGECVWWAIAVADALAGLHRAGLAHGAIDASAVWIGADDVTLGGVDVVRLAGEPAQAPDDVAALGALLAACVTDDDAARVHAWTEPMTDSRPEARPTAAMVARALTSCAPPDPIRLYPVGIAAALRRAAGVPEVPPAVASEDTELLPEARWWRARQRIRRALGSRVTLLCVAAAAALGVVGFAFWGLSAHASGEARPLAAVGQGISPQERPDVAARALTQARIAALAEGDGEALIALTVAGGEARNEAQNTAQRLNSGQVSFDGLAATVVVVDVLERPSGRPQRGDEAVVRVEISVGGYSATTDGMTQAIEATTIESELVLEYDLGSGWLVASAR